MLEAKGRGSQWEIILGIYRRPGEWGGGGEAVSGVLDKCKGQLKIGYGVTDNVVDL